MTATFRALAGIVATGTDPVGKEIAVVDLNWDGQSEILLPVGVQRAGAGGAVVPWDGVTPLDTPMLVLHYKAGEGLSLISMKDVAGAPLVIGWAGDVSIVDFNGDGHADVLWSDTGREVTVNGNFVGDTMRLILSSAAGPVVSNATQSAGGTPVGNGFWHSSGAGDVNGDGKMDFVTVNLGAGAGAASGVDVFLGDGKGGFTFAPDFLPAAATSPAKHPGSSVGGFNSTVLQVADMNGDGRPDLILGVQNVVPGGPTVRESRIFWNTGNGYDDTHYAALAMPPASVFAAGGANINAMSADRIRIGDINGDGRADALIKYTDLSGASATFGQILLQNADQTFTELPLWAGNKIPTIANNVNAIEALDVNGDGRLDIVLNTGQISTLSDVASLVWISMGDGTFKSMAELAPDIVPTTPRGGWATFADLDGDGQVEILHKYFSTAAATTVQAYALKADPIQAVAGTATIGSIFADAIIGTTGADTINGFLGHDVISAGAGDDIITGGSGNDRIDGGDGSDTAVYSGRKADYTVASGVNGWTVTDLRSTSPDGVDTLVSVEFLQFSDGRAPIAVSLPPVVLPTAVSTAMTNILRAGPQSSTSLDLASSLSTRIASGMTAAQAQAEIVKAADATTSVATLAYEFFTGKIPSASGIDYLVSPTGPNPNNLNSAYYQFFNIENRYINFSVNLGKNGDGKAAFAAAYGDKTLLDTVKGAYTTIFGSVPTDAKVHALIDSRVDYFASYGLDGPNGIGTKAAAVGWLLAEAAKADVGMYSKANDAFLIDLADGAAFAVDIIGVYGKPEFALLQ